MVEERFVVETGGARGGMMLHGAQIGVAEMALATECAEDDECEHEDDEDPYDDEREKPWL